MSESYQNEIPKARVNIALSVEKGGATERKELPLKLLAVGDFSNGKGKGKILNRQRINIHKNNLNQVLKDLSPEVNMVVDNKITNDNTELGIKLQFQTFNDFTPEKIAAQIPELNNLIAMRNLLKDLKSNLLDNTHFRQQLEKIISDAPSLQGLHSELDRLINHEKTAN